jgi:hypothetical protein
MLKMKKRRTRKKELNFGMKEVEFVVEMVMVVVHSYYQRSSEEVIDD